MLASLPLARALLRSPATTSTPFLTRSLRRPLTTTPTLPHPVANQAAYPNLLVRDPARDLPTLSSLSSRRRWLLTLPVFLGVLTASALGIFNYQKVNSPITTATLYAMRTNPIVREALGDEVYFASKWAWIWGQINLVQGKVDVSFRVKGTRQKGVCRFVARRLGGKGGRVSLRRAALGVEVRRCLIGAWDNSSRLWSGV